MKIKNLIFSGAVFMALFTACQSKTDVRWVSSTDGSLWVEQSTFVISKESAQEAGIVIDRSNTLQTIDGFGGSFNELGWEALQLVSEKERDAVISAMFDPVDGCKFNICRMSIGANDYAVDWYSHNETPGDFAMEHFSIDRDRKRILPYIRQAMEYRPDLKIWGSPWSPPSWMKANKHYACASDPEVNDLASEDAWEEMKSQFIMEDKYLSAYALYFSKFVQAYLKEGVNMYAVHVQNEPNSCQNFPSCIWTPEGLSTFIGKYLGPQFEKDALDAEIWLGTIERPHPERVDPILQNPETSKYLTGVGFQWAGKGAIPHVNENYPDMKLMQTETECGHGSNDWPAMEHTFNLMKHYFNNGANSYMYWNFVLDYTGDSQWGWKQNSMITVTEDHGVVFNPEFYLMKHFSYFIEPGAKFIKQDFDENCLAFLNPGGDVIVVYYNETNETMNQSIQVDDKLINIEVPAKSLHTFQLL